MTVALQKNKRNAIVISVDPDQPAAHPRSLIWLCTDCQLVIAKILNYVLQFPLVTQTFRPPVTGTVVTTSQGKIH